MLPLRRLRGIFQYLQRVGPMFLPLIHTSEPTPDTGVYKSSVDRREHLLLTARLCCHAVRGSVCTPFGTVFIVLSMSVLSASCRLRVERMRFPVMAFRLFFSALESMNSVIPTYLLSVHNHNAQTSALSLSPRFLCLPSCNRYSSSLESSRGA